MKNKEFNVFGLIVLVISILFFIIEFTIGYYAFYKYRLNNDLVISSIVNEVVKKYPEVKEEDLIEIINSDSNEDTILKKYSINVENEYLASINKSINYYFMILILLAIIYIILILLLINYYRKKNHNNLNELTNYLNAINHNKYMLDIENNREDEVSILKNEIYKTAIKLNEQAKNLEKEKVFLKDSLSDISHQLRTPLTSITIMMNNIMDDPDMKIDVQKKFLLDINRKIINMSFLIETLLKLSKFDAGTIEFKRKSIYVSDLIDEVKDNLSVLCDLKSISINYEEKNKVSLMCDAKWELEALSNIIKNCIEHSKSNSNVDVIASENELFTRITIKDYGEGISKKDLKNIFKRFYKGENSSKDSIGIGMSLAKTIIEADFGMINIKTKRGEGTTFIISYYKKNL